MVTASDSKRESKPKVILLSRSRVLTNSIQSILGDIIDVIQAKTIKEVSKNHKGARCILMDFSDDSTVTGMDLESLIEAIRLPKIAVIKADNNGTDRKTHPKDYYGFIRLPIEPNKAMSIIIKAIFR